MPRVIHVAGFLVEVTDESVHGVVRIQKDAAASSRQPALSSSEKMGGIQNATANAVNTVADIGVQVSETIGSVCGFVQEAMSKFNRPDEIKLKFGIKIAGEAGIPYLTKGSGEAVLEIEATWKNVPDATPKNAP